MPYIKSLNRDQLMMCSLDSFVDSESIARLIDAFVESLDMEELEFTKCNPSTEGRPAYNPKDLLKLYIYGNRRSIRSSRKLQEACKLNVEVKWLLQGLEPDFRTISDFRKENVKCMKKVFHEFNRRIASTFNFGFQSVDGSKFQANNSKDANFTISKLDDRIEWLNNHSDDYLRQLDELDKLDEGESIPGSLSRDELEAKLTETKQRLEKYECYRALMEKEGLSQLSITDADAKLMKNKNGFAVAYNIQTAIDSETHLITNYKTTNRVTDHGLLNPTLEEMKDIYSPDAVLEAVADKGYNNESDMAECLEKGIIPHVILPDGKDTYTLEIDYVEAETDPASCKPEDLSKSLHAGKIPDAYKDVISSVKVVTRKFAVKENNEKKKNIYGSKDEMIEKAKQGYFVRDPERNLVYCPTGNILRQKCIKKNGNIRYANKMACRNCPFRNRCIKGSAQWKEIDFSKDDLEKANRNWIGQTEKENVPKPKKNGNQHYEKKKIVKIVLRPDKTKMQKRMCLSEHPFGTIKRSMNAGYFLLRGLVKVDGEFALAALGYNLQRAKNLLGFDSLMSLLTA